MSLMQKIAEKMREKPEIPKVGSACDYRDWARRPKSQMAVNTAIAGGLIHELECARKAGYVIGIRWVPPHQRNAKQNQGKFPLNEIEREPGCDD